MYNKIIKEDFISQYTSGIALQDACVRVFNIFEKYELEWGADLCTRSKETLEPIVNNMVGFRRGSERLRLSILKDYVKWCIENNVSGACDGMLRVEIDYVEKMRLCTVTSPAHLQSYLNRIYDPEEEETTENIYRCYYWLAYAGMKEEDILNVKAADVDLKNRVVKYDGREYEIYNESLASVRNCMLLTDFKQKHQNPDYVILLKRVAGDTLVRGIYHSPSVRSIRVELSRRSRRSFEAGITPLKLSYYRVWLSGVFYRLYEMEMFSGIEPDFLSLAYFASKQDKARNSYLKAAREFKRDYETWKMTLIPKSK